MLSSFVTIAQTNYQLSQLRNTFQQLQVLSPSAEMRSLIRFDNVEVSPYTGVPDINIPLFNFECTKDLNFDMSLRYHPDAIKRNERAGSTGLGWSLFAGGSITRVVRGLPDECVDPEYNIPRFGLYLKGNEQLGNDLDDFINNQSFVVGAADNLNVYDKLFEALESGTYDTQYDLYYYNFMGYSGSFYVKMNNSGTLTVVKLEDNSLKISATRETFNANIPNDPARVKIASFTIYDETGNKFFFDIKETTSSTKGYRQYQMFSSSSAWDNLNDGQGVIPIGQNNRPIVTAYHLTNITPYTSTTPIVTFAYGEYSESFRDFNFVKNNLISTTSSLNDQSYYNHIQSQIGVAELEGWTKMRTQFGSSKAYYINLITTNTQKLKTITYNGKLFIDFTYEEGRADQNFYGNPGLVKLSNIKISTADTRYFPLRSNTKLLKQFKLNYVNAVSNDKKMLLKEVIEYKDNISDELTKKYKLYYNSENSNLPTLYEDPWGYCTNVNPENSDPAVNVNYLKTFVLEKMEVPTGGAIIYNYEPHTYSYIGNVELVTDRISKIRKNETGGGIRIKNIGFFDDKNVSQNYYALNITSPTPNKEITYKYNLTNQAQSLSSGSLSFPKPVFKYQRYHELFGDFAKRVSMDKYIVDYLQPNHLDVFKYETTTNYNNLYVLTTKGANVGYKNVIITERDNGKKELTFTSPIDYPEENYTTWYPFIPSKNIDYKRGLLLNEKNYNSNNNLVSEINNTYTFTESEVNTGIIPFYRYSQNCLKTVCQETGWIRAGLINTNQINCHNGFNMIGNQTAYFDSKPYCTSTEELMTYKIEKRVVGWAKLVKSERTDYLPDAITTTNEFTYNSINKKISSAKNIIGSDVYSTDYEYLNATTTSSFPGAVIFPNRYNRIADVSKITTKKNETVLATENIVFKDINPNNASGGIILAGSQMYVPEKYQYAKGGLPLQTLQTITRMDERGNPLEITNADGSYSALIWGYNKTRLMATVENCHFSEIETLPIYSTIISQSFGLLSNSVTTDQILTSFTSLRNSLGTQKRVTSVIYELGKGVVCKTDPNGKSVFYDYNELGNLKDVKDNDKNLLKQYFEFYKN